MIAEALAVALWALSGAYLSRASGLTGLTLVAGALPVGTAAHVAIGTLQVGIGLPTDPSLTVGLLLVLTAAAAWRVQARDPGAHVPILAGTAAAAVAGAVLAAVIVPTVTADSYRYLLTSGLLAGQGDLVAASSTVLQKRMIGLPLLHSLAGNDLAIVSLAPLLAISTIGLLVDAAEGRSTRLVAAAAALALVTNSRFLYHAAYLNGHLVLAAWLLAAVTWARRDEQRVGLAALLLAAMAVTRPEGSLLALSAAVPFVVASPRRSVAWLVAAPGATTALWYATIVRHDLAAGLPLAFEVVANGAVGLSMVAAGVVAARVATRPSWLRPLAWAAPWVALVPFIALRPELIVSATAATWANVRWEAHWGSFLVLLLPLVLAALWWASPRVRWEAAYPLVTFVPVAALLGYIRGGGYRVGPGDSLARMLMHVVPLALAFLVWAVGSRIERADDGARGARTQGVTSSGR